MADFDLSSLDSLPAAQFTPASFASTYGPVADQVAQKTGIDANTVLGQWGLETGWGKSVVPGTNNLGNIKSFNGSGVAATDNQTGTTDKYQQFATPDDFANSYADLLSRKYKGALNTGVDANATAKALVAGGYAEDPNYASKLIGATSTVAKARGLAPADPQGGGGGIISSASAAPFDPSAIDALPDLSGSQQPASSGTGFWSSIGDSLSQAASHPGDAVESLAGGLGKGFGTTVLGAQNLLGRGLSAVGADNVGGWLQNDATTGAANLKGQSATLPNQGFAKTGDVIGASAPALVAPAGILAQAGVNAGIGAADSAAEGGTIGDIIKGGLFGGAAGGAGAAAGKVVGGLLGGIGGKDVQALRDIGVSPTIGQSLGPLANKVEQRLTSIPLYGDAIAAGRQGANNQFNQGLVNDALSPIGQTVGKGTAAGSDSLAAASKTLSDAYDSVLPQATFAADPPFFQGVDDAYKQLEQTGAPQAVLDRFQKVVTDSLLNRANPSGVVPGQVYQLGESNLTRTARNLAGDADSDNRSLGQALSKVVETARDSLQRNSPAGVGDQLAQVRQAYAKFKTVETAAGGKAGGQTDGIFTPQAYNRAVKTGTTQGQRARGTAFNQNIANAGVKVLGSAVPDSGTAGRIAQGAGLGALGATALTNPLAAIGYAGGAGLTHLLYTDTGRKAVSAILSARPDLLRALGGGVANNANVTGGLLGGLINSQGQ